MFTSVVVMGLKDGALNIKPCFCFENENVCAGENTEEGKNISCHVARVRWPFENAGQ